MIFHGKHKKIASYLRLLANRMGLRDWTIHVSDEAPVNGDAAASACITYGRKFISIRFDPAWASDSPETFRQTCVHELLHAHLAPLQWAVQNAELPLGAPAYHLLRASHHDALEVAIDAIASEWAETLPLPGEKGAA